MKSFSVINNNILYFYHIPKTGGTSLQYLLEQHFKKNEICSAQVEPEFQSLSNDEISRYKFFAGHFWSLPKRINQFPWMLTFLRRPTDRAVSMYKHILRDPQHGLHVAAKQGRQFESLSEHPALKNSQTRHLARVHTDYTQELSDSECILLAKEVLDKCRFVGITEDLATSVKVLYKILSWDLPEKIPSLNQAHIDQRANSLTENQLTLLREANQVDELIYSYAMGLFQATSKLT